MRKTIMTFPLLMVFVIVGPSQLGWHGNSKAFMVLGYGLGYPKSLAYKVQEVLCYCDTTTGAVVV
jgi:hypothetical protein